MKASIAAAIICLFGLLKEFRPATPFLTPYLESSPRNISNEALYSRVYPIWTYSYCLSLIPILILADVLRYKPIVIIEAVALTATWVLLVFGRTVEQMQIMQIIYGIATSAELGYSSYLYAVVARKHYRKVTSYVRAATLLGKFSANATAQLVVNLQGYISFDMLNMMSLVSVASSIIIALFVPSIKDGDIKWQKSDPKIKGSPENKILHKDGSATEPLRHDDGNELNRAQENEMSCTSTAAENPHDNTDDEIVDQGILKLIKSTLAVYGNGTVLFWSLWWSISSCGVSQVGNYVQALWIPMQKNGQFMGNGAVECTKSILSILLTLSLQYWKVDWKRRASLIFPLSAFLSAVLLFIMAKSWDIIISYIAYTIYASSYHLLMAAAYNEISLELKNQNYAAIFGLNTFVGLVLQSALTLVVNDEHGLALDIRAQFLVYSGVFGCMAIVFVGTTVVQKAYRRSS